MQACTIQLSGGVEVPGIDRTMSLSTSMSGCAVRIFSITSRNSCLACAGLVRGLSRKSMSNSHDAGDNDAVLSQPAWMNPICPCGATRPEVCRLE
jgi:hypothetical protein